MLNSASLSLASAQGAAALQRFWPGLIGCSMTNLPKACFQCATGSGLRVCLGFVPCGSSCLSLSQSSSGLGIEALVGMREWRCLVSAITTHALYSRCPYSCAFITHSFHTITSNLHSFGFLCLQLRYFKQMF